MWSTSKNETLFCDLYVLWITFSQTFYSQGEPHASLGKFSLDDHRAETKVELTVWNKCDDGKHLTLNVHNILFTTMVEQWWVLALVI